MSYYRYGKEEKKITFADTDKRHAELRVKLRRDGISQVDFFKSMVTGYIDNDPNILMYTLPDCLQGIFWDLRLSFRETLVKLLVTR